MKLRNNFATDLMDLYHNNKNLTLKVCTWHDKNTELSFFTMSLSDLPQYFFEIIAPYQEIKELRELKNWVIHFVDKENYNGFQIASNKSFLTTHLDIADILRHIFELCLNNFTYKHTYKKIMEKYGKITKWIETVKVESVEPSERKE